MRFFFYLGLFIFILSSCKSTHKEIDEQKNLLVDNLITVSHLYSEQIQQSLPWKNSFKVRPLISSLFHEVLQNNITLYNPIFDDTVFVKLEKNDWLHILKNDQQLTFDTTQFDDIYFFETWQLDTILNFNLQKNVVYWSPVKREKQKMKLAGKVKCTSLKEKKQLAQQIIYEFPLTDTIFLNERLNKEKLVKILLQWAINNPSQTFNPFTAQSMTKEDIYKRLKISDSSIYLPYRDINSILFVENWYYDTKTYSIQKEILSIAPVVYLSEEDEISKQILFVLHPKNKPFKLL